MQNYSTYLNSMITINQLLKDLFAEAKRSGLTPKDLAQRAGLSTRTLDGCENIPKWRPTVATVRRLEKALPKVNGRK